MEWFSILALVVIAVAYLILLFDQPKQTFVITATVVGVLVGIFVSFGLM